MKKQLPKPAKVAATHALRDLKFEISQIASILGIGERSVSRYLTEVPEDDWRSFGEDVKKLIRVKEDEVAAQTLALIEKKLPHAQFRDLVGLYKILRELRVGEQTIARGLQIEDAARVNYIEFVKDEG